MTTRLGTNIAANMVNAGALIAVSLVTVPLILSHVGTAGYGIWTLGLMLVLYVTLGENAFGPAVQRFVAVARGAGRADLPARLLWTSLALYFGIGVAALITIQAAAPGIVALFDLPSGARDDAASMFRIIGLVVLVALLNAALGNVLMGMDRFRVVAGSSAVASLAYLVALASFLAAGHGLPGLAYSALVQYGAMLVVRTYALRALISAQWPALVPRADWRAVLGFSAKLQVTVMSWIFNSQSDKVVTGLVAPATTLGQLGIGTQVAEAGRLFAGAAMAPMTSSFSHDFGRESGERLRRRFVELNRAWFLAVFGATVIGVAALDPLIEGWLGSGYEEAVLLGGLLVAANGANLLTGVGVAYLRATGRPQLEAKYGVAVVALNIFATIPLALVAGAVGVVAGTLVAYAVGTAWFFHRLGSIDGVPVLPRVSWALLKVLAGSAAAAGTALAWGLAVVAVLPPGFAVVPVALGTAATLVAYLALVTGVRPTFARLRAVLRGEPSPEPVEGGAS